jgi:hypothetical protein
MLIMEIRPLIYGKSEKNWLFVPIITLGTANSACSAAFYARISGIRANPLKYTDPDGKTDYIYFGENTYKTENDWGFWEFLHKDRYFVETEDGSRLRANSKETVTLYDWKEIDSNSLDTTLPSLADNVNNETTNFKRIMDESIGGYLDFKNSLDSATLYLANNILYNNAEFCLGIFPRVQRIWRNYPWVISTRWKSFCLSSPAFR